MKTHHILFLLFVLFPSVLKAQQPRSEILKNATYIQLKNNSVVYMDTVVIRINNRMGDYDAGDVINFQKGEKVFFGTISIEDENGNLIRKVNKKEIQERSYISGISLYEDRKELFFTVKHHKYPYLLKYTKLREVNRYTNIIYLDYSNYKTPIKRAELTIEHPIGRRIKQQVKNVDNYRVDTLGQTVSHKYTYSHNPVYYNEAYRSVNTGSAPQLIISPIEFYFGIRGINENWESFGQWIYLLNKGRDGLPQSEKEKIDDLIKDEKNKQTQIKILYQYLQDNTRYVNVSTLIGGLQTHTAEYVANNKYGDCKALTNYMCAMLKHIGVESYPTLIYNDDKVYDIDSDFSYNAFNHVILSVPINGDTLLLECTSKNTPMGYVGSSNQGRKALLVKDVGSRLIDIPSVKPDDVLSTRCYDLIIDGEGNADLLLETNEQGENYELLNAYDEMASKNLLDYFVRQTVLDGSFDILGYEVLKQGRDSAFIGLKIKSKINRIYKKYGNNLVVNPLMIDLPKFENVNQRTQELQMDYPIYQKYRIRMKFLDMKITQMPTDFEIQSPYGDLYVVKYTQEGEFVIIEKELLISAKRLTLEEYKDFYNFIVQVKNNEISNYYFEVL